MFYVGRMEAPIHRYHARLAWTGSTAAGYDAYGRAHTAGAPPARTSLTLSADPAFRGDPTELNPEQLLVLAASSCQLLSFLAVAARSRINVISYHDEAEGEMSAAIKPLHINLIRLRPRIGLGRGQPDAPIPDDARVRHLVALAHRECYIANSLKTEVLVEPMIIRE